MQDLARKAADFRALHDGPEIFVMPNAWDAGSARFLAAAGFTALGTTSGGVNWAMGREDYVYETPAADMLAAYGRTAAAVDLPVSGDLENGYGAAPETVADTIEGSIEAGLVGGSIEDSTSDAAAPLYEVELAVARIRAARTAADASGLAYTLTARCEAFYVGLEDPYPEAVRRANLYRAAGADCLFVPAPMEAQLIADLVRDIDAPLSVVAGLGGEALTVSQLAELGVRRISTGGGLARSCYGTLRRAAEELARDGSFGYTADAIPDAEIQAFFRDQPAGSSTQRV